jgi:hypothetical protein
MEKLCTAITVALAIVVLSIGERVYALPPLPASFYGTVQSEGANVPDGTWVTAWIDGVEVGRTQTLTYEARPSMPSTCAATWPGTPRPGHR